MGAAASLAVAACLAALVFAAPAASYDAPDLSVVPATYTGWPVTVHCDPEDEMDGAWGYTRPLFTSDELWMEDDLCAALLEPGSASDWLTALAVLVITHESWHLRVWLHALDEARVECAAIRRWHESASMLGISDETQARLWPWALVAHYYIGYRFRPYRNQRCKVPTWPPWET